MNQLIEEHLGYAHSIARSLLSKYPSNITRADLERAAEFGLVQAARAYDPGRGIPFSTFAYYRIRGAIFDEIRQHRRVSVFQIAANERMAEQTSGTPGSGLEETFQEVRGIVSDLSGCYLLSLSSLSGEQIPDSGSTLAHEAIGKEEARVVERALNQLPGRYQAILRAHYYHDLSFGQIGKQLNLSKSCISRTHTKALALLAGILKGVRERCKAVGNSAQPPMMKSPMVKKPATQFCAAR